jgi:signal transduction histidine kinase
LNVLSDAIKFTHIGSVEISVVKKAGDVEISIKDTGIGIDEVYYEHIFEPFSQIRLPNLPIDTGVGLGLSNVRLMLKKIGGVISVESAVGRGSIFTIRIPCLVR